MGAIRVYWRHGAWDGAANDQVSSQPRLSGDLSGKNVLTLEGCADNRNGPSNPWNPHSS